jgi:NAD-specific glutamate dehydrogenase
VVDVLLGEAGVLDGLLERAAALLQQVGRELLELGPAQALVQVQRALAGGGDERQVDLRLLDL